MVNLLEQFKSIKEKYNEALSTLKYVEEKIDKYNKELEDLYNRKEAIIVARSFIQDVAFKTQKNLEFHVSSLVTTAIKHVSEDWPEYLIEFVKRRNKTECDLFFYENNRKQHPLIGGGGGVKDTSSFAQLISYWTLNKNRPSFFLDEPFRNVSPDLQYKVSDMLEMLCEKIKIQIIMISHADDINVAANKTFLVVKTKDGSIVRKV